MKVCMALLVNPNLEEAEGRQSTLFAPTREEVAKKAYEAWVEKDMGPKGWITSWDRCEAEGNWVPHLQDLASRGKHEEALREVWEDVEGVGIWFEIFEGEM